MDVVGQADLPSSALDSVSELFKSLQQDPRAIGTAWMVSSALFTTYSTTKFLKYESPKDLSVQAKPGRDTIPRPALLTLYRFAGSLFLGLTLPPEFGSVLDRLQSTIRAVPHFALPALFLFVANFSNSISLDRVGISLTYTSKCGIPLITVLLTLFLDGWESLPGPLALLSLISIAVGIAAASWNSPTFELAGFLAAMVSMMAQSALNVSSKRAIQKTGVSGPAAQRVMVLVGLFLTLLVTFVRHIHVKFLTHPLDSQNLREPTVSSSPPPVWLSLMAVVAYHVEYCLSFMFVKLVQPITYGTCDAVRRLSIILTGRALFGGAPLTRVNVIGIALALLGALAYSIASSL